MFQASVSLTYCVLTYLDVSAGKVVVVNLMLHIECFRNVIVLQATTIINKLQLTIKLTNRSIR